MRIKYGDRVRWNACLTGVLGMDAIRVVMVWDAKDLQSLCSSIIYIAVFSFMHIVKCEVNCVVCNLTETTNWSCFSCYSTEATS